MPNPISMQQITAAYDAAKAVYDGQILKGVAVQQLGAETGLNRNSARDFINDYAHMLRGEGFQRAMSARAMHYFLSGILRDRGPEGLAKAIVGVQKHIIYYENLGRSKLNKMRTVVDFLAAALEAPIDLSKESAAFKQRVMDSQRDTHANRLARLQEAPRIPIQVLVMTRIFRRDADVVAEVLSRAAGTCESCHQTAPFKRRSDGTAYLEVHHRKQLANGGEDTLENALAVCPNCHR